MPRPQITVSIVSHRQNGMLNFLLSQLERHCAERIRLVITENVPDPVPLHTAQLTCPVQIIRNDHPKGYGANHNAAFAYCDTEFYCVCNPDVTITSDPFAQLLDTLQADAHVGVVGPLVRSPTGNVEDSARCFPTVSILLRKLIGLPVRLDYPIDRGCVPVEWVAGMFMLLRSEAYRAVNGFDEAYYLYYEDVDICRRLHEAGWSVLYEPGAQVVHEGQRASRKDGRLALQHLASIVRYFTGPRPRSANQVN